MKKLFFTKIYTFLRFLTIFNDNRAMENNGIRKFRERLHIKTQAELAEMLGVEQTSVSVWELGKSMPGSKIMQKLLKLGATVEELFGVEYNKMHNLGVLEASPASSNEKPKKLSEFEADLLREILDEYADFGGKLESIKKLREVYKLEREIKRGDKTTDLAAKKQRLQELQEQIEKEIPWSDMFETREDIKSLEEELKEMEEAERYNSYERPRIMEAILDFQSEIEKEMYFYVDSELKKLTKQEPTNEKNRKLWLEQELRRLKKQLRQTYNKVEVEAIGEQMDKLEEELTDLEKGG